MELDTSNREKVVILHSNSTVIYWEQFVVSLIGSCRLLIILEELVMKSRPFILSEVLVYRQ